MTDLAAHTDNTFSPLILLMFLLVLGGLFAAFLALTISRIVRGSQPREQQMARLAGQLNGRDRVCIRTVELRLADADLRWVAHSRGYEVTTHAFGSYHEFIRAPYRGQPVNPGPWQGRP
ncbi:hypothetical protein [Amycolatopsis sp. CA-128772]|uniref:hypothetical protein n=1 Tax=Amycolatopsis sp. CA-128772 TaxID=2073159 RepID=UPI001E2C5577|nr:hypothetical protein [Amycolatopsis sp. CA-128772]